MLSSYRQLPEIVPAWHSDRPSPLATRILHQSPQSHFDLTQTAQTMSNDEVMLGARSSCRCLAEMLSSLIAMVAPTLAFRSGWCMNRSLYGFGGSGTLLMALTWKPGEGYDIHLLRGGARSKSLAGALDSADRYVHTDASEEARRADLLPTPKRGAVVELKAKVT